ncbi:glycerophosphoryl diester phosphodiesterase family protein [Rhizodiscina lignyota]|uniref:glycerophosphodiester phosphodiesterase n=1 Tax=Rhizodiscina lignyota TaxID=1504668 RepID=A0A9P4IBK6_9PEZI|nr:glycerophosphoryl diester phosphodiesterase family protein [Rhizodiscina lignyota]
MLSEVLTIVLLGSFVEAVPAPWGGWGFHHKGHGINVQLGPRPYYLVDNMDAGPLKEKLQSCTEKPIKTSSFSIGHRGAPLQFPEHSRQSYMAAARMGAGQLVCRHSQCDLHFTTNILETPLAAKCSTLFKPANPKTGEPASANCCTSDITLAEFKSLCAKMEGNGDNAAVNGTEFQGRLSPTPDYRTDLYATCGTPMSHKDSIELINSYGLQFTPELKTPEVDMPFQGDYTQEEYAQQMIDEYKEMGIDPSRVWPQSFLPDDIFYWIDNEPEFAKQAVYLDERVDTADGYAEAVASLPGLKDRGVKIMAPAIFALVNVSDSGEIVPSPYAEAAKEVGLDIITWSWERDPPISQGVAYYYQSVADAVNNDGDEYTIIDVVARKVGALKMFADWPGTITYYANCFGIGL